MERSRRMPCATSGARHAFTLFGTPAVQRRERGRKPAPFDGGDARLSVGTLRRLGGTTLVWAWVIAMLFLVNLIGLAPGSGPAYRGVQTCALGGAGIGLALLACLGDARRRAILGARGTAATFALSAFVAIPLCAARFEPWTDLIPLTARMALWVALGLCASCALWRSVGAVPAACHEVRTTAPAPQTAARRWGWSCLGLCSELAVAAALLDALASRTDVAGATVFILALIPLALLALPTMDGPSAAGSCGAPDSSFRSADSRKDAFPLLLAMATIGLTCGFHTVMGSVLYASLLPPTNICLCIAMAALFVRLCLAPLSSPHRVIALQTALCLTVVAFAPLLFLEASPLNRIWGICQYGLVALTTCALLLAASTIAATTAQRRERNEIDADTLTARQADRAAADAGANPPAAQAPEKRQARSRARGCALSTRALAFFFVGIAGGWLLGTVVGWNWGVSSIQFKIVVTLCIACLLACIVSLSVLRGAAAQTELETEIMLVTGPFGGSDPLGLFDQNSQRHDAQGAAAAPCRCTATEVPDYGATPGPAGAYGPSSRGARRPADQPLGPYDLLADRFALSERERELLGPLATGRTAQQIANDLMVSRNTIKSHMAHIYTKFGIHTRAELIELVDQARAQVAAANNAAIFASESVCATEPLGPNDPACHTDANEPDSMDGAGDMGSVSDGEAGPVDYR